MGQNRFIETPSRIDREASHLTRINEFEDEGLEQEYAQKYGRLETRSKPEGQYGKIKQYEFSVLAQPTYPRA